MSRWFLYSWFLFRGNVLYIIPLAVTSLAKIYDYVLCVRVRNENGSAHALWQTVGCEIRPVSRKRIQHQFLRRDLKHGGGAGQAKRRGVVGVWIVATIFF